jgi:hypothetical protein
MKLKKIHTNNQLSFANTNLFHVRMIIYSPTKDKHHLTCFNNIFSNNELISNRFSVFVTCTHTLTYLWNRPLIDFYLCVYDRVCKGESLELVRNLIPLFRTMSIPILFRLFRVLTSEMLGRLLPVLTLLLWQRQHIVVDAVDYNIILFVSKTSMRRQLLLYN